MKVSFTPKFDRSLSSFCKLTLSEKVDVPTFGGISQFADTISPQDDAPYILLICRAQRGSNNAKRYNVQELLELTEVVAAFQYHSSAYLEALRQEAAEVKQQRKAAEANAKLEAERNRKRNLLQELKEREEQIKQQKVPVDPFDPNQADETLDTLDIEEIQKRLEQLKRGI
jgi:hypothetical protein